MRDRIVEFIRQILRKTVLPIRKKKNELLSKFHFSISFRINMNYMKLFFLYGAVFLLAFSLLYMWDESRPYSELCTEYAKELEETGSIQPDRAAYYQQKGVEVEISSEKTDEILFKNRTKELPREEFILRRVYYSTQEPDAIVVIRRQEEITVNGQSCEVWFQYNMTKEYRELMQILWKLTIIYVILGLVLANRGKKETVKLLSPIDDMSQLANSLNVDNLGSERINVAGTKNELKDLASLINTMLDRIETSYESQKQFVSDASHELRTPIAVIQGYANMLHRWGSKDEAVLNESIEAINNEAKSMQDLVEKLLFLSRHDKKTLKLNKKRFNMAPIIEEMVKETKLVAQNREILCPAIEPVMVYGDPQALKQAVRVFVDNAIKYTKDGDKISISCKNKQGDCVIAVEDTGIGMNKRDMDHIFQRFYRSDTVRNQNISGHGLGLSLAKLIILAHVGRIKVRSQFTVGSSFIITIPMRNY